jgi:hypothetical protein
VPSVIAQDAFGHVDLRSLKSTRDLSLFLGVRHSTLVYFANAGRSSHYRTFNLRKRSGASRPIEAPVDHLKEIQRRLAAALSAVYVAPRAVHGFVSGRGIVSNAIPHAGKRWVVNLDLKDSFNKLRPRSGGADCAPLPAGAICCNSHRTAVLLSGTTTAGGAI